MVSVELAVVDGADATVIVPVLVNTELFAASVKAEAAVTLIVPEFIKPRLTPKVVALSIVIVAPLLVNPLDKVMLAWAIIAALLVNKPPEKVMGPLELAVIGPLLLNAAPV